MEPKPLFDPFCPEIRANPFPVYKELRDHHPAYYNEEWDFFALSRFADIVAALEKPLVYSSAQGISVGTPPELAKMFDGLIMMDPPRHTQMRAIVNRAFTPRRIAALEPRILGIANELIDEFIERGDCDFVDDFAGPLPTIVIAELLGVPTEDRKMFKENSNKLLNVSDRPTGEMDPARMAPFLELIQYLNQVFEERRKQPRDDLMSALLAAEVDGQKLNQLELTSFALLLLIAGNETTTNLISIGLDLLHDHPDQRARLVAHPDQLPAAIEEFLRFDSPAGTGAARTLTEEVEWHSQKIRPGQKVMLLFGSGNRDERRFEAPDVMDTSRKPTLHLGFGYGTHFCLGASLARLESRIAFERLLARTPEYKLVPGAVRNVGNVRGFSYLPTEFEAA